MEWTRQNGNSSTNTVAWTIVQSCVVRYQGNHFAPPSLNVARRVKHLEYHETR